jgi:alpha-L-arabinofuranosidase
MLRHGVAHWFVGTADRIPVLRWPGGCFADEYHWMEGGRLRVNLPSKSVVALEVE